MPRTHGGMRGGTPGRSYQNRSDIGSQPNLPARVATGQTYGKAQSQLEAQKTVPMAPPRLALPPAPQPGLPGGAPGSGGLSSLSSPGAPPPAMVPGGAGDIHRPTERPFEPVTAGIDSGPGPGSNVLQGAMGMMGQVNNVSAILARAAQSTGSAVLSQMAARAQASGQ